MAQLSALARYVAKRFGFLTRPRETDVNVTAAGVLLLGGNPNRVAFLLTNTGTVYVTVSHRGPAVLDRGIRLDALGGSALFEPDVDGESVGYPWYAISSGVDANVTIDETIGAEENSLSA